MVPYTRAWGLQLGEMMQARLPAELREMVYNCLWDTYSIYAYSYLLKLAGGSKCFGGVYCQCIHGHEDPVLPYFIRPDFVGASTAGEIVRALSDTFYYKGDVLMLRQPEHIKNAISKDVFHISLDPGQHLRSLFLRINLD